MRLYELSGTKFEDDLINILKVMQGHAKSKNASSYVSWSALNNLLLPKGHGQVTKEIMDKIIDKIDSDNTIIQKVDDSGITLNTSNVSSKEEEPLPVPNENSKTVDQMAHNVIKKELS